jgi:hypothetical protein
MKQLEADVKEIVDGWRSAFPLGANLNTDIAMTLLLVIIAIPHTFLN